MKPESKDDARQPRPLPVLREMIDAVDHQILELMAQRNEIVNEVAHFKRTNAVRIRDFRRERELLSDRRNRATDLGINTDVAESLLGKSASQTPYFPKGAMWLAKNRWKSEPGR